MIYMTKKIVVTGIGTISSIGNSTNTFWSNLINGKIGYIDNDDNNKYSPFKIFAAIKELNYEKYLSNKEIEKLDICTVYSLLASIQAIQDSNISFDCCNKDRVAVIIGTTTGTNPSLEKESFYQKWFTDKQNIPELQLKSYNHCDIPNTISKYFGLSGVSYLVGTACAAGNHAIGDAADMIRLNKADVVICGGSESLGMLSLAGFNSLKALAKEKCSPFDKDRDGIVIGEGAGILILESEEHALKRNAKIYSYLSGWSINCDAESLTSPIEDGTRVAELINECLKEAKCTSNNLQLICLHGTATKKNDVTECNGIKLALGTDWQSPYSTSIKSMIGHTFGAAGALNSIAAILAINKGSIPPTINLINQEEGLDLNIVKKDSIKKDVNNAISLSFGFGGCNVACLFSKYKNHE